MNETHPLLSTKVRKGAIKYHNPRFDQTWDRGVNSSRQITVFYTTNLLKVIPPLYIFDSMAEKSGNFKIETSWYEGLPTATRNFGQDKNFLYHYSVDGWQKGSMDESLFQIFVKNIDVWTPTPITQEKLSETI